MVRFLDSDTNALKDSKHCIARAARDGDGIARADAELDDAAQKREQEAALKLRSKNNAQWNERLADIEARARADVRAADFPGRFLSKVDGHFR